MLLISILFAILTPFILTLGGIILCKNKECDINDIFGYRTSRSMKNRDNRVFANELCGKILFSGGIAAAVVSICAVSLAYAVSGESASFVSSVAVNLITAAAVIAVIPYVENKLKKFEKENENDQN